MVVAAVLLPVADVAATGLTIVVVLDAKIVIIIVKKIVAVVAVAVMR
jgi:hypothetical protein